MTRDAAIQIIRVKVCFLDIVGIFKVEREFPLWVNHADLAASAVCRVIGRFQTWQFAFEGVGPDMIQVPKRGPQIKRQELTHGVSVVTKRVPPYGVNPDIAMHLCVPDPGDRVSGSG